ncbi:CHAT domain-containing protein [Bacteroides uniformis]|nr:CHAT domain-containing protein [Bacteroides uniformis]
MPEGLEDGILTAKELAGLDLRGLDLVVLSACQTGLGEITGDGVFGLQRGFKKAGANTLLMSLWKVDDNATQLLMTQFYKNLLAGKSKFESLREAQKYVRDYEVEIETTPDKRWQSEARQKEKTEQKAYAQRVQENKKI